MGSDEDKVTADYRASLIPATIRIGVTGHRQLENEEVIRARVREELDWLDKTLSARLPRTPHVFIAVSPLAEGSDLLVAEEVLDRSVADTAYRNRLDVILPMPEEIYLNPKDFNIPGSNEKFLRLKGRADSVRTLAYHNDRTDAFESVGLYVVRNCDVLFVIWDGEVPKKPGGTYYIFEHAKKCGRPYVWIDAKTGDLRENTLRGNDNGLDRLIEQLRPLDNFNSEWLLDRKKICLKSDEKSRQFFSQLPDSILSADAKKAFRDNVMPRYARASLLSQRYKKYYDGANRLIYVLAALAVTTIALQMIFLPDHQEIVWLEVAYMTIILVTVFILNWLDINRRWIDYRFLTERLRIGVFLHITGIDHGHPGYFPPMDQSEQTNHWTANALSWIWRTSPEQKLQKDFDTAALDQLRIYIKEELVDDQYEYYKRRSGEDKRYYHRLEQVGILLFCVTLVGAFFHAYGSEWFEGGYIEQILSGMGIILPAFGASIAGILYTGAYLNTSKSYSHMIAPLGKISARLEKPMQMDQLVKILEEANDLMLWENQDWRVSFLSQKLKPP